MVNSGTNIIYIYFMKAILCFGEILWDVFNDEKVAGGAPMNVARHLEQQWASVGFASSVGTDADGQQLVEFLKTNGLFSDLVQLDDELSTCKVTVKLDEQGHATYTIPQPVSWDNIRETQALADAARNAEAIIYGSLACREEVSKNTLISLLKTANGLKVFDVNLRPPHYMLKTIEALAGYADVIKMNDDEIALLSAGKGEDLKQAIINFQKKYHTSTICITRGENGAIAWHKDNFFEHPGYKTKVVDTVGAGDSFLATFVNGLLKNEPMEQLLDKACRVGAFVAGKRGANPIYDDTLKELLDN